MIIRPDIGGCVSVAIAVAVTVVPVGVSAVAVTVVPPAPVAVAVDDEDDTVPVNALPFVLLDVSTPFAAAFVAASSNLGRSFRSASEDDVRRRVGSSSSLL